MRLSGKCFCRYATNVARTQSITVVLAARAGALRAGATAKSKGNRNGKGKDQAGTQPLSGGAVESGRRDASMTGSPAHDGRIIEPVWRFPSKSASFAKRSSN
jgi:hypothetical protein